MRTLFAVLIALSLSAAAAAEYPDRPVRMLVPFAAGGGTDATARVIAEKMQAELGQPVIVENRGGAGGRIGAEEAAAADPDGHTVILHTASTIAINPHVYADLAYDPLVDFAPVALVTRVPNILIAHPSVAAGTLGELLALLRASPGVYNYASSGNGSILHLSGALFTTMAGVDVAHIPYRGSGPAMNDLVAGQVELMFDNVNSALPQIEAGTAKAIAVTTATRVGVLPDVPTMAEAGLPGYETASWTALFAPAGTPEPVIAKLNAAVNAALADPGVRERLEALGNTVGGGTPGELAAFSAEQLAFWGPIVETAGVTLD